MDDKLKIAYKINDQEVAIDATKLEIKTQKEMLDSLVQSKQAWLDLQTAKEEVDTLKAKLESALKGDSGYNNLSEEIGQLKDKLKDQKETLSDLIVGYALDTKDMQLEVNDKGDARNITLVGKLGKKGKYQTNLFV